MLLPRLTGYGNESMDSIIEIRQFYWGKFIDGNTPRGDFRILATSPGFTVDQAENLLSRIYLGSHERVNLEKLTHAYSFAPVSPDFCVFAHIRPSRVADRGHKYPIYHGLVIPTEAMQGLQLRQLLEAVAPEIAPPEFSEINTTLPTISVFKSSQENITDSWGQTLKRLRSQKHNIIEAIINVLLSKDYSIFVEDIPSNWTTRIEFVQALWDLLPHDYSHLLSFGTEVLEGSNTEFKIKCLHSQGHGRKASDLLVNFETLELENNLAKKNWYSSVATQWLIESERQDVFSKKIQTLQTDLKQIKNMYPELQPTEQLNLAGANHIIAEDSDLQNVTGDLIGVVLDFHRLLPEKMLQKLSLKLFDIGFQTQQYAIWRPLLANGYIDRFYNVFLKRLKTISDITPIVAGLRYWLLRDISSDIQALLLLFFGFGQQFVKAVQSDVELLLCTTEILFTGQNYDQVTFMLNNLTENTQIEQVLSKMVDLVEDQNQLNSAFYLVRATIIPATFKKAFYFKLIELSPQTAQEIGIELLEQNNAFPLSSDEKFLLLTLDLPNQYRNQVFLDVMSSTVNQRIGDNNYSELLKLLEGYQTKRNVTDAAQILFANQGVYNFVFLTSQVLDYFERLNDFVRVLDANSEDANGLDEVSLLFSSLNEEEYKALNQTLNTLRDLLEYKGILTRSLPTVTALRRIIAILQRG